MGLFDRFVDAEYGRFALWLPVGLFAGVLGYFALPVEPPVWLAPLVVGALAGLGWGLRRHVLCGALIGLAVAVAVGVASGSLAMGRAAPVEPLPSRAVIVQGVVSLVEPLADTRRVTLAQASWPGHAALRRDVRVRLRKTDLAALAVGDVIEVRVLLRPPPMPAFPGAWDLQRDAYFANRAGGGTALGAVSVVRAAEIGGVGLWWQGVRQRLAERLLGDLPGPAGAIAATLVTGLGGAITAADRAAFRDSGLAHLLAVAGLHIGAVMGAVFFAVRFGLARWRFAALRWPCKQIAGVAALAAGLGYLLLTGAHVPIQRSFAMACLVTLGLLTGRRALSLRGLALAAVVILLISPDEAVGVSFQMSFAAVMALIAGYEALRPVLARWYGLRGWRWLGLHVGLLGLTSLLAGGASMPVAAYHFGQLQMWFVPANLIAVPLTALFVLPAGMLALLLMPLGLEQIALQPMGWVIEVILWIARFVSSWPAATLRVPQMPNWGALCVGFGLCWLCLWRSRARLAGWAPILLGMASIWLVNPPDVLVSSEARLIGVRSGGEIWLQSVGGARFTIDAWEQAWGVREAGKIGAAPAGVVSCEGGDCRLRPRPEGPALLLSQAGEPSAVCDAVVLVVSAQPAANACPRLRRIDRFTVWRNGAHAVWLTPGGAILLSDRMVRGSRPWVPGVRVGRGQVPDLPMAPRDEG